MIRCLQMSIRVCFMAGATAVLLISSRVAGQTSASSACSAPEYHQFDFWVGDWEVTDEGDPRTVRAHARVERILDGCVLREIYEGSSGIVGQSFSIFDRPRGVWHQTWVTSHGQLLVVEGGLTDGKMVLSGADKTADGKDRQVRGTWIPEKDGFRETAVRSTDGGKTWEPWFDLNFRPVTRTR